MRYYLKFSGVIAIAAIALLVQACAPAVSPQQPCNFVMSSEAQRVSWGPNVPVVMYIDSSVPNEFYGSIQNAVNTWNQSLGHEVLKIGGWSSSYSIERQDGANVIYFKHDWSDAERDKQAVTTIHHGGDRIFEADIRINGSGRPNSDGKIFEYSASAEAVPDRVDFESLILHEFGHVLGQAHPADESQGTVMAKVLTYATLRRTPAPFDVSDLKCEY
jgi:hypothetical protein